MPSDSNLSASEAKEAEVEETLDLEEDDDFEYEPEPRGASVSSRILLWLFLLVAGGIGALWGGPKVAPYLPEWAQPVAKFLSPGGASALAAVEELGENVTGEIGALKTKMAEMSVDETLIRDIATKTATAASGETEAALTATLDERIGALSSQLAAVDGGEIEGRLTKLESRIEGISAELTGLTDALKAATLEGAPISEETLDSIATNANQVAGIQAELGEISSQVGGLSQRIDEVEAASEQRAIDATAEAAALAEEAEKKAQEARVVATLAQIDSAIDEGRPFADEIGTLAENGVETIPDALSAVAESGVATTGALQASLVPLTREAIQMSIKENAGDDTLGRVGAFFQSQMTSRSLEATDGDDVGSILSRVSAALGSDDLATVGTEVEALPDSVKTLLGDWLGQVDERKSAKDAIAAFGADYS